MANKFSISNVWKKTSKHEKILSILALAILVAVFLPWVSVSTNMFMGEMMGIPSVGYSYNGLHSYGFLTFLGSLAYLLWKYLPILGVKLPKFKLSDLATLKILALVMLSGPVIWILSSGFYFRMYGVGMWIALAAAAVFTYMSFTAKKA